jgi:hypothetical protein
LKEYDSTFETACSKDCTVLIYNNVFMSLPIRYVCLYITVTKLASSKTLAAIIVGILVVAAGAITFVLMQNPTTSTETSTTSTISPTTTAPPEEVALTVFSENATNEYTMTELQQFPDITGEGGYVKTTGTIVGPYNYTGVTVKSLLQELGELPIDYSIEVLSSDGYATYFTKAQVDGRFAGYTQEGDDAGIINATLILAYYEDGAPLPEGGPLRMATLNNARNLTDGHFWAKDVVSIELINEVEPWTLQLDGVETWNMTHDIYYALGSCSYHRTEITLGNDTYTGVPLWIIVSAMDGADDDHYQFNSTLVSSGYQVVVFDALGNNITFSASEVALNSSILIAG